MKNIYFKLKKLFPLLLIIIPSVFVFRNIFFGSLLAFGDAPSFSLETLRGFLMGPTAWTQRATLLGGVNNYIFIYPLMFILGALNYIFGLESLQLVRMVFYIPSILLSLLGTYSLVKYLKYSKTVCFFTTLLSLLNTYFLLLLDGGQVGVALAYGIFPIVILASKHLIDTFKISNFIFSSLSFFILLIVDPRIAVIAVITLLAWIIIETVFKTGKPNKVNLFMWLMSIFLMTLVGSYWIYPFLKLNNDGLFLSSGDIPKITFLHSLSLFSPHWPGNIYGHVEKIKEYFHLMPALIFSVLLINRNRKTYVLITMFVLFAFLSKGTGLPLGKIYEMLLNNSFGSIFRDSTKFFIPTILFAGILIGLFVETVNEKIHSKLFGGSIKVFVYLYLLFLIFPALSGKLNFVLSTRTFDKRIETVNDILIEDQSSFRIAWFPEKHPLAYETDSKPATDAKNLIGLRPLYSPSVGTYDKFNYMRQINWQDWYRLLGFKYIVFSGDQRLLEPNTTQKDEWNELNGFIATQSGISRVSSLNDVPVYSLSDTFPRLFSSSVLVAVVGSDNVYEFLGKNDLSFLPSNQPFVFLEDGLVDSNFMQYKDPKSIIIIFNNKSLVDFQMGFLKEFFIPVSRAVKSDWKVWKKENYQDWKYQLLIRDISTREFDYNFGVAMSTVDGEDISFKLRTKDNGQYYLISRTLGSIDGKGIRINAFNKDFDVQQKEEGLFQWNIFGPFDTSGRNQIISVTNLSGTNVLNLVGLVSKEEWDKSVSVSRSFLSRYQTIDLAKSGSLNQLSLILSGKKNTFIDYKDNRGVDYEISTVGEDYWITLTDVYNPSWKLFAGGQIITSLPFYSAINGFYNDPNWVNLLIKYEGNTVLRWGIWISLVAILVFIILLLILIGRKHEESNK